MLRCVIRELVKQASNTNSIPETSSKEKNIGQPSSPADYAACGRLR